VVRPVHGPLGSGYRFGAQHGGLDHPAPPKNPTMYTEQIKELLSQHARLLVDASRLEEDSDLYQAGLTSLSTVNLMLALEEHFDVEFLDRMLGRKTFGSIRALNEAIAELRGEIVIPVQTGIQSSAAAQP
jgi:acyl carrier protein